MQICKQTQHAGLQTNTARRSSYKHSSKRLRVERSRQGRKGYWVHSSWAYHLAMRTGITYISRDPVTRDSDGAHACCLQPAGCVHVPGHVSLCPSPAAPQPSKLDTPASTPPPASTAAEDGTCASAKIPPPCCLPRPCAPAAAGVGLLLTGRPASCCCCCCEARSCCSKPGECCGSCCRPAAAAGPPAAAAAGVSPAMTPARRCLARTASTSC
jgi:hypothetical protein